MLSVVIDYAQWGMWNVECGMVGEADVELVNEELFVIAIFFNYY